VLFTAISGAIVDDLSQYNVPAITVRALLLTSIKYRLLLRIFYRLILIRR
jgi:hypothetical protein